MTRPMKLSPTGTERISPVRRTLWPSSMPVEVTEDDDTDLAGVEVQRDAERAVLELQQLVGHRGGQAGDAGDAVTGCRDGADLLLAGGRRLVVVDVLLERVPDLLRTDRKFGHVPCPLEWVESCVFVVGLWCSAGEPAAGVVEPADDGAVDDVVADLDPEAADQRRVDDHVQLDVLAVLLAERGGQPLLLVLRQLAGGVSPWRPPRSRAAAARSRNSSRARSTVPRSRVTACPTSTAVAGRILPSRRPWSSALRSSAVREWSASAPRSVGLASIIWRTANSSSPTCLPLAPAERTVAATAELLEGVGQVLAADPAPAHGVLDQAHRRVGEWRAEHRPGQPRLRLALDRRVGQGPAQGRVAAHDGRDAEQVGAERRGVVEGLGPSGLLAQLGQRLGRGSAQHQDGAPFRAVLLVSSDSRSARNRSTTRPLRSSSSRASPTIRPASEVARVPTSARSEVSACCRSAAIWACACSLTRCASTWACSLASAMMPLPCSRASSRIRAGLLAGVGDLGLELLLGLGRLLLGLLGLGELLPDRVLPRRHRLVDRRDDVAGEQEEQQQEGAKLDEERGVGDQEVAGPLFLLCGRQRQRRQHCREGHDQAPRTKTNRAMKARLMKNIASTRPTVRKKMVWSRPWASG